MKNSIDRRTFLKTTGALSLASLISSCDRYSLDELREERKKRTLKKRRIIMNNDGNEPLLFQESDPVTVEKFLEKRTTALVGSHVDAIFYCTGVFNFYTHQSQETELFVGHNDPKFIRILTGLKKQGTDPLEIMTDFCHSNNIEMFWSMRMNDTHDSGDSDPLSQWKKDHPDYLVGRKEQKFPYGANRWSSVNYELPQVRDKVFHILQDVCSRYNIEGIELDFFRHPVLFKPQMTGEPVTQAHCDMLTDLIRSIRQMTEKIGLERRKPFLIAIRVPDSVGYCKALGIDLIRWLEEDLVDIITGGGYFKLELWSNWAALGQKYGISTYACFVKRRIQSANEPEGETSIKIWRGEALNALQEGVNGI